MEAWGSNAASRRPRGQLDWFNGESGGMWAANVKELPAQFGGAASAAH